MILKPLRSALFALILATTPLCTVPTFAQSKVPVQFQRGSDSIKLNGTIVGREYIDYILRAKAGQTMSVSLDVTGTNGNGSAFFNILPPGSQGEAIFNGSTSPDRSGKVKLPEDGDYTIRVYLMGNDYDTGKTVGYTVSVTIPPSNTASEGSSSSVSEAESNCLAAVAKQTGVREVSTLRVERAESGIGVLVKVRGAQAPWQCVVDTDGKTVVNVYYTGDEGAL